MAPSSQTARKRLAFNHTVDVDVAIIGAGFGGLCMAIQLKKAGYHSFVVYEKESELGGAWRDNVYPGCACDVASHLYSFSFEPNPSWSRLYPPQGELLAYQKRCATKHQLGPHMKFNSEVTRAEFDEATSLWKISVNGQAPITARILVPAMGILNRPKYPKIPGLETFAGEKFHSSRWNNAYSLDDKSVAVIGVGASAIQFIPKIAPKVKQLYIYQRTPAWVMPHPDRAMTAWEKWKFRWIPGAQKKFRQQIYNNQEEKGHTRIATVKAGLDNAAKAGKAHLEKHISDPALRAKLMPDYLPGCKRILISNEYYPTLNRPNVELVTDAITEIRANGVVTGEAERRIDALILATGFRASEPLPDNLHLTGRDGRVLGEEWKRGGEAYYGMTVAGYPNLYFVMGPNTYLGHNSILIMIEAQVQYILSCLNFMREQQAKRLEISNEVQAKFNAQLQEQTRKSVWSSGCDSWYLNEDKKNTTLWPDHTWTYSEAVAAIRPDDYIVTK